jgi:hypothetical protein
MKALIVSIPDDYETLLKELFGKLGLKSKVLSDEEYEDKILAKWIKEGMKTEDVPLEKIYDYMRKNGVNC